MTPSTLKHEVESRSSDSYYFTRQSMKFFGDTMKNYGVRDAGDNWELYRKRAVKHGMKSSAFFDKVTFAKVNP